MPTVMDNRMRTLAILAAVVVLAAGQWFPLIPPVRRFPQQVPLNDQAAIGSIPQYSQAPLALLLMQHYLSRNVTVEQGFYLGRPALKVSRSSASYDSGLHRHTYVELPLTTFYEGTITVDIATVRNGRSVSASAGLAFRMQSNDRYDLVYLRTVPFNGIQLLERPSVQYIASPSWTPDKLRLEHPWHYEATARVADVRWNRLRIDVFNQTLTVFVNSEPLPLIRAPLLGSQARGAIAYWVGDGTDAYFSGLVIREGISPLNT